MKDVTIEFNQSDKSLLDNLIRMLGRAKMELEGVEILVAADSMRWLSRLQKQIEEQASAPPVKVAEVASLSEPASPTSSVRKGKK